MWSEQEEEIYKAIEKLGLNELDIKLCDEVTAVRVQETAKRKFVIGTPSVWWLGLKDKYLSYPQEDCNGFERLKDYVPNGEMNCWFIPETEGEILPVFDTNVETIGKVLKECFLFEYYLVGKLFDWLLIDTDHNEIIVCTSSSDS